MPGQFELWHKAENRLFVQGHEVLIYQTYQEAAGVIQWYNQPGQMLHGFVARKVREPTNWREREARRLIDGTYRPAPFANDPAWITLAAQFPDHFLHCSRKKIAKLDYTENEKKADGDVQTPIAPSEYLARFAPDMLKVDRARLLSHWANAADSAELKFARTTDEILDFMYREDIPGSCMTGRVRDSTGCFARDDNPYRVYGEGSDVTVAYLETGEGIVVARVLVWEAIKLFSRVYGDQSRMSEALRAEGYAQKSLAGAKINKIKDENGGWVMPYLDAPAAYVKEKKDHFVMSDQGGDYGCCATTCGFINGDGRYTCEACEEQCEETYTVFTSRHAPHSWCEHCRETAAFYCEGSGNYYGAHVGLHEVNGNTYSEYYVEDNFCFCDHAQEYTSEECEEVIVNANGDTQSWSVSARAEHAFECRTNGKWYANALLSPLMADGEEPICKLNDERYSEFHAVPEQATLELAF